MHHEETVWQNTKWREEERKKYKVSKEKYTKQITWSVVEFKIMHVAICAPGLKCVQVCYVSRSDWLTLYCHTPSLAHQANNESIVSRILSILHRSIVWRRELKMYIFPIVFLPLAVRFYSRCFVWFAGRFFMLLPCVCVFGAWKTLYFFLFASLNVQHFSLTFYTLRFQNVPIQVWAFVAFCSFLISIPCSIGIHEPANGFYVCALAFLSLYMFQASSCYNACVSAAAAL